MSLSALPLCITALLTPRSGAAYGINNSNGNRFTVIGGGLPIVVDGAVVGAVGCSTGTPAQDQEVAQAGVDAANRLLAQSGARSKL